jgi:predicted RND superfamily exporter protein
LKAELTGKAILRDNVISADGSATGVILTLDTLDDALRLAVVDSIRGLVGMGPYSGRDFYLAGNIPIRTEMYRVSSSESGRFVGICALVMLILLWVYFSSLTAAAAAVSVSILTVLVTLGLFSAMGFALNLVAGIIPLVLMVVSLSVSIHIISRIDAEAVDNSGLGDTFRRGVQPILKPCLFSALTTGVAFSSFLFSGIGPLRVFGAFCALGVFLSFILAFLLVPVILTLGGRLPAGLGVERRHDLGRALEGLVEKTILQRRIVLAGAVALLGVGVLGVRQLTFETDQIKYLHPSNPVREASRVAEEWFSGVYPLEVVLELPDSVQNRPEHYLSLLSGLEEEISALEEVAVVHTVATALRDFVPEGPFRSLALAALGRQEGVTAAADSGALSGFRYLAPSGTKVRLSVKARWMDNEETILLMSKLDGILEPVANEEGISYFYTGTVPMFVTINRRLTNSQISSFLLSFICIFLLILLLFRSLPLAILGMIPNILPVVTTVGIMGLVGVPMDVATVLIAAISLGIAVDDTIHFLWAFRERQVRGVRDLAALDGAIRAVGRPLILTSLVLVAGFLTMTLSSYLPVVFLGVFVSLNVLLAILLDIILLPALISLSFKTVASKHEW